MLRNGNKVLALTPKAENQNRKREKAKLHLVCKLSHPEEDDKASNFYIVSKNLN